MLAAPIYQVNPQMGADLIIVVFAVVVIGGMGSIMGAIVTGFGLGIVEGLTKVFYPGGVEHGDLRHHGHRAAGPARRPVRAERLMAARWPTRSRRRRGAARTERAASRFAVMLAVLLAVAPFVVYPVFLMKALCFALFACAFNLLLGYGGLLSFGHALFFGWASYVCAYAAKAWGWPPELAILRRHRGARPCSASSSGCSRSAGRASISP